MFRKKCQCSLRGDVRALADGQRSTSLSRTMELVTATLHPACVPTAALLLQCEVRRQRRSGPGGQHRNKVETAVVLVHGPTGIRGEASERRSQTQNLKVAVQRLRVKLAIG